MKFEMRKLLTICMTLLVTALCAQVETISTTSAGGAVTAGVDSASLQSIVIFGDPGASAGAGIGDVIELTPGFLAGAFQQVQAADSISEQDSLALVRLYVETAGAEWTNNAGWIVDPVDQWFGVSVEGDRVVGVNLAGNNLVGFIPDEIRDLTALATLNLSDNSIGRDIPAGLGLMSALRIVNLSNNQLEGFIPDSLGLATSLAALNLGDNNLEGTIPASMTNMVGLRQLRLANNQLFGALPDSIGKLSQLERLDLTNNQLEDTLPASLAQIVFMREFRISNNLFTGPVPDLSTWSDLRLFDISSNDFSGGLPFLTAPDSIGTVFVQNNRFTSFPDLSGKIFTLDTVNVERNNLGFASLEPNTNLTQLDYIPQDSLGQEQDTLLIDGNPIQIFRNVAGTANVYHWLKDGAPIDGTTNPSALTDTYNIPSASATDEGSYVLTVTNDLVPGLTLFTAPDDLNISSRNRDSLALEEIYKKTGGANWENQTGWLQPGVPISEWFGVTMNAEETRVTGLDLSSNGLVGKMPRDLRFIGNLQTINVQDNDLISFPDLRSLGALTSLNVRLNRLSFADLLPNRGIETFIYDTMKTFGQERNDTIQAGEDYLMTLNVPGRGNKYQWIFDPFSDLLDSTSRPIADAILPFYTIDDIDYFDMGIYQLNVQNDSLPDLTITTSPWNIYARDDLFGRVFADSSNTLLTDGSLELFRVFPSGNRYRRVDSVSLDSNTGEYVVSDVILGDFVLRVFPGVSFQETVRQTYYISTGEWQQADTLRLRRKTEGVDIIMRFNPGDFDPADGGSALASGSVFTDFETEDDGSARIERRRRARRAACFLSRRTRAGGGRSSQQDEFELVAYVESDDNGEFSFNNIPPGEYQIEIQYPGVPMDESTQLTFTVSEDREGSEFTINAVITDDGVEVAIDAVLGNLKPYLKEVTLFPNPTDGMIRMNYLVYRRLNSLRAQLLDLNGRILKEQKIMHRMGRQKMEMDITEFKSGAYFLRLTNDKGELSQSIRILKK